MTRRGRLRIPENSMQQVYASGGILSDAPARQVLEYLKAEQSSLGLTSAVIYYDFPVFRGTDDALYRSKLLLISPEHGVVILSAFPLEGRQWNSDALRQESEQLAQLHSVIFSKLLLVRALRRSPVQLALPLLGVLVIPGLSQV